MAKCTSLNRRCAAVAIALVGAAGLQLAGTAVAYAQMMESYRFQSRDRASIAFAMRQVENESNSNSNSGLVSQSPAAQTVLVCGEGGGGGDTASSSTANSTCLILNNSTGQVSVGQDNLGNQDSNANTETTQNNSLSDTLEEMSAE